MQHIFFSRLVRHIFFAIELANREGVMVVHEAAGAKLRHQKYYRRALDVTPKGTPVRLWLCFINIP
jgi:hypothetical protein